jgi:replicative DNA helicase
MNSSAPHPNNVPAEGALLGGLIKKPEMIREIDLDPDDLWREDHRHMYRLLIEMLGKGEKIDMITLPERVAGLPNPSKVGGVSYVFDLESGSVSTANLSHYADLIRECADLRRVMHAADRAHEMASRKGLPSHEIAEQLRGEIGTIGATGATEWQNLDGAIIGAKADMERREQSGNGREGLTTGFPELDRITSGICPGKLYVIGGRPAMGKTGLAMQIAMGMCADPDGVGTVGFFSMEMDAEELGERAVLSEAGVDSQAARRGALTSDDWEAIMQAEEGLRSLPLSIDDKPGRSLADIVRSARKLEVIEGGVRGIVIDYLQLMDGKGENQNLRIAAITKGLKALARDMKIPVILLSQLSRDCEKRGDKRPMMSDLRDSGGIEQDADLIAFVYRDEFYNADSADSGLAEVIIRKQRKGPTGIVKLAWNAGRFAHYSDPSLDQYR